MTEASGSPRTSALAEIRAGIVNVAVPHNEPPSVKRRRRIVVAIVLLLGAALLGLALRRHPGELSFYWLALTLAAVWAIGAFVSGPLHLGGARWRGRNQRPVISGTVIGLLLGAVFVAGGLIAREIPAVSELITRVLERYRAQNREMRACEPRDLIERAHDICRFRSKSFELTPEILDLAWIGYFGEQ